MFKKIYKRRRRDQIKTQTNSEEELVLTIPENTELYSQFSIKPFFNSSENIHLKSYDYIKNGSLRPRNKIEGNFAFVQIVAYTIVLDSVRKRAFVAKRISGDKRLQDSYCLGFGGHVDSQDFNNDTYPILNTAIRELREELVIKKKKLDLQFLGYVRDIKSATSEHLGFVYLLDTGSVSIKEKDKLVGRWVTYDELKSSIYPRLESWSRYALDYLYESEIFHKNLNF